MKKQILHSFSRARRPYLPLLAAAIAVFSVSGANAATIIDGSLITVTVSDLNSNTTAYNTDYVVDGSGITSNYGDTGTEWFTNSSEVRDNTWIAFDLGAEYVLDSIHVWNGNRYIDWGINQLDVYVSTVATPGDPEGAGATNWTQIGTNVNFAKTPTQRAADSGFDFETQTGITLPTTAVRHIRFEVDTAFDGIANGYVGLNEVQFTAVPEPSAALLLGLALLTMLRRRRR